MSGFRKLLIYTALCIAVLNFLTLPSVALDLVRGGKSAATIVIPAQPLPIESYAAKELQYHVKASSGVELAILSEDSVIPPGACIYLGHCKATTQAGIDPSAMPGNGYIAKTVGKNLFIAGKDSAGEPLDLVTHAGTLFGVYDILENNLGVRWLWPGKLGEVIPAHKTISLPALDAKVDPLLWFNTFGAGGGRRSAATDPNAAEIANQQNVWARRHRAGRSVQPAFGHAFGQWWAKYGATHPEYFDLLPNGQRGPDPSISDQPAEQQFHMCVSSPGLVDQIIANWKAAGMPPYINVCENDGWAGCTCPNCMAEDVPIPGHPEITPQHEVYKTIPVPFDKRLQAAQQSFMGKPGDYDGREWNVQLGQLSDRYAKFWKAVSEEARKYRPDVIVGTYMYDQYRKAPLGDVQLSHNVLGGVVTWAYYPYNRDVSSTFQRDWDGWYKTGCLLFLRPNFGTYGDDMPFIYSHLIGSDVKFAMAREMKGVSMSITSEYSMQGPNAYVIAKVLNHPDATVDGALNEFYAAFGPAKSAVKAYFDHFEAASQRFSQDDIDQMIIRKNKYGQAQHVDVILGSDIFTPEIMKKGRDLLDLAAQKAAADPIARARVAWLAKGLKQAELTLDAERAYERAIDSGDQAGFTAAYKTLTDWRASQNGDDFFSNMKRVAGTENKGWFSKTSPFKSPQ